MVNTSLPGSFQYDRADVETQEALLRRASDFPPASRWTEGRDIAELYPDECDPIAPGTPIASWAQAENSYDEFPYAAIYLFQSVRGVHFLRLRNGSFSCLPNVSQDMVPWGFSLYPGFSNKISVIELSRNFAIL